MECLFYLFLVFLVSGGIFIIAPIILPFACLFIGMLGYGFYVNEESKIGLAVAIVFVGAGFIQMII